MGKDTGYIVLDYNNKDDILLSSLLFVQISARDSFYQVLTIYNGNLYL